MTIEQVKFWVDNVFDSYDDKLNKDEIEEAKRIVNKSLDAVAIKALEQQSCEDCVSKQAILDIIMPYCQDDDGSVENTGDLRNALDDIESLPPATSKGKTGKWIYTGDYQTDGMLKCSECGEEIDVSKSYYDLCPVCGARMVSE